MAINRGFTLLELLVVLTIMVLLTALVPPLVSGMMGATELRAAARQLAAGLRYARNEAITKQQGATLTVNVEEHRFTVTGGTRSVSLPANVAVKLYTARSEQVDATTGSIRFFPDGSSTGGHISLADRRVEYRVNVDWLTGRVDIVEQAAQQ